MNDIDYTKAFITLADEDVEMDPVATQAAIDAYLAA